MITRRKASLLLGAASAFAQGRASVGLISDPSGPHLQIYLDSLRDPSIGSIGIADATAGIFERAAKTLAPRKIQTFQSSVEMLKAVSPQLVLVALEARLSPPAIELALQHGAHVLAEKPACVRAQDFARLTELAGQRKRNLMLAFASRLHPVTQRARALIAPDGIGKPMGVTAQYIADQTRLTRSEYQKSWFADKDRAGGGHLIWLGIHYIDLIQFLTRQKIVEVSAQTANTGGQPLKIEDSAALAFRMEGGGLGTLQSAYYLDRGYQNEITIWGSEGWLRFDPSSDRIEWYRRGNGPKTEVLSKVESYPVLVHSAIQSSQAAQPPVITAPECLQTLRVVFTAYEAARTHRSLPVES